MNEQTNTPAVSEKTALRPLWHRPIVTVYEMSDAESGGVHNADNDGVVS